MPNKIKRKITIDKTISFFTALLVLCTVHLTYVFYEKQKKELEKKEIQSEKLYVNSFSNSQLMIRLIFLILLALTIFFLDKFLEK